MSYFANRNVKWYSHFVKQFGSSSKYIYKATIRFGNFPFSCLLQNLWKVWAHKSLYRISSIIHSSQEAEATQMSTAWLNINNVTYSYKRISLSIKKIDVLTCNTRTVLKNIMHSVYIKAPIRQIDSEMESRTVISSHRRQSKGKGRSEY
jgi:hypothetical protein